MAIRLVFTALLCTAITSCDRGQRPPEASPDDVMVAVADGAITSPDSVLPGWSRVRVDESGGSHIVVVFRLPVATSDSDVGPFIAALDTSPATPPAAVAMGGPEIGQSGDVIMYFTPGRYVIGCVRRGDGGHRHASTGEAKTFVVPDVPVASARGFPPVATHEMQMTEFAFGGSDKWRAGPQVLRIENTGSQDHQLRVVRLSAGSSMSDWLSSGGSDKHGTPVVGLARMGPGQMAYLPVDLESGSYVAYCLVADATRRQEHIELGMYRAITVE
jgi:hypothetical protein